MIPEQLGYDLAILFVGVNPHPGSDRRGVPFSNNKMFWYLLEQAGVIDIPREKLKDDVFLQHFYAHDFKKVYRLGALNIINHPTVSASGLTYAQAAPGRTHIMGVIARYRPRVVCFVGKITYQLFAQSRDVTYGWQPDIAQSHIYVMHAPHRGPAAVRVAQLREILGRLQHHPSTSSG